MGTGAKVCVPHAKIAFSIPLTVYIQLHPQNPGEKDDSIGAKRKWFEECQKQKEEELQKLGLDPSQGHRWVYMCH